MADDGNVKVFCRVRPPNEREGGATPFTKKCVTVPSSDPLQQTVTLQLKGAQAAPKVFTFDRVFHELASQNEVFELVGVPITRACLEGYNGTIFAYGQTGSGKTFTMQGPDDVIDADERMLSESERGLRGLVPRVFDFLFQDAQTAGPLRVPTEATRVEHTFACSFMEIYNERVYDLLDNGSARDAAGLTLRENGRKGVSVEGLIESVVTNAKQAAELMAVGARNRRVGQTAMNRESSRSHSVFVLQIQSKETTAEGITRTRLSRFNLVDLAGSERQRNTEAAGERLKEAGSINKSLSALGNVIMGLVEQSAGKNRHVHYRDSKLTFLLKDSLGGNSKTFMIATVSPAEDSSHETLSTLKFAQRAKLIRNNAVINEDTSGSVLVLQEEILRLRRQLQEVQPGRSIGSDLVGEARLASDHTQSSVMGDGIPNSSGAGLSKRLEELEVSLSFALEKNENLKRKNGQLSVQSGHMQALCSELKRNMSSLKLRLRLQRGSEGENMTLYDSSADAIEWRMKYEQLEEAFMELQDRFHSAGLEDVGEVEKLSLMYETLAKQLAHVIREKHDISRRLEDKSVIQNDDEDKLADLEAEMMGRSIEFESRFNAILAANSAAEAKAEAASLELLHSKQKEAAWKIDQQQSQAAIAQLQDKIVELQKDAAAMRASIIEEKQQRVELEVSLIQDHTKAVQHLENQLAEKMTENFELSHSRSQLEASLQEMLSVQERTQSEVQQLQDFKSELEATLEHTKRTLESEQQARCVAEAKVATTSEALLGMKADNQELRTTVESLKVDALKMTDKIGSLQEELTKSSHLLQVSEDALQECKKEMKECSEDYKAKINALNIECADLSAQRDKAITDHEEKIAVLQERHRIEVDSMSASAEKAASEYKMRVSLLQAEVQDFEARLDVAVREVNALNASTAKQKEEDGTIICALKQTIEEQNQDIVERDAKIVSLSGKKSALESELSTANSITFELRSALQAAETQREDLRAQLQVLEEKFTTVNGERGVAEEQVQKLTKDIATQQDLLKQHEDTIASGLKKIEDLEGLLERGKKANEKLGVDIENARQALDDALAAHQAALAKREDSHKTEIDLLSTKAEARIEGLQKTLDASNAEIKMKVSEIECLQGTLKSQLSTIAQVESELATERDLKIAALDELTKTQASLRDRDSTIFDKSDQIARANERIEVIQEKAEEERVQLSGRIRLLEADLKDVTRAHDVLTSSHATLTKLHQDTIAEKCLAQDAIAEHTRQNEILRNQVADLQSRNSTLSTTIEQFEHEIRVHVRNIEAWKQKNNDADATIADLKRLVTQRDDELDEKDSVISGMEEKIENLEADKERVSSELRHAEVTVINLKKENSSISEALETTNQMLRDVESKFQATEDEYQAFQVEQEETNARLREQLESKLDVTIKELEHRVEEQRQDAESLKKEAAETERALQRDIGALRQELDHASEKASRLRKRNEMLVESNAQLSQDLEEREAAATKQLEEVRLQLSATEDAFKELETKYKELPDEFNTAREDSNQKETEWERKEKEIEGRTSVVAEMELQIAQRLSALKEDERQIAERMSVVDKMELQFADESKKIAADKVAIAQRKKEAERIKREYEQSKARVEELEATKIQLSKEKEKYRREVNILTMRLDQISKENDKLVGHDNMRQRIQHHIKVKEENNRLQAEVRLLTEEKLKLEVRVGRLELSLKEKENMVNAVQMDGPRSPSSSKSSTSTRSLSQSVPSKTGSITTRTVEMGSLESASRKRLRSLHE